jgi:hypothetical protein
MEDEWPCCSGGPATTGEREQRMGDVGSRACRQHADTDASVLTMSGVQEEGARSAGTPQWWPTSAPAWGGAAHGACSDSAADMLQGGAASGSTPGACRRIETPDLGHAEARHAQGAAARGVHGGAGGSGQLAPGSSSPRGTAPAAAHGSAGVLGGQEDGGGRAGMHGGGEQICGEARGPDTRDTRAAGSGYHGGVAPDSFDCAGNGDDPQAQSRSTRKRCAADAAGADANEPPAKKGQAAKYRGGCVRVHAARGAAALWHTYCRHSWVGTPLTPWHATLLRCVRKRQAVAGKRQHRRQVCASARTYICRQAPPLATLPLPYPLPRYFAPAHTYFYNPTFTLWNFDRLIYQGMYDTSEDAARVVDFTVLSLRGVDTQAVINFDKGAYLGADGALLPVEAALPGLGRDEHNNVRDRIAAEQAHQKAQQQEKQQLRLAQPTKHRGGCMRVHAVQRAAVLWCMSVNAHAYNA